MDLTGVPQLDNISFAALVVLTVISLLRGWIVPGRSVERIISVYKEQNDNLRATIDTVEESRKIQAQQIDALTAELSRTTEAIAQALPRIGRRAI